MLKRYRIAFLLLFFALINIKQTNAQAPKRYDAAEIQLALNKLNVLGSVLYIVAHPDDENTRLISYLAKEKLLNTGNLSLTRGDGGQNLVGSEIREQLGLIRTHELLEARKIDGGRQFFTRANDFGFSKTPEETFTIWDKEGVLADMVWVIRKFRPDVLVTRFAPDYYKTHGHHVASAQLAMEAFEAAGDKNRFKEQLKYVEVWQPKRILWNISYWFFGSEKDFKTDGYYNYDVGQYNELLGKSYTEIAAEARSMHRSQGFGTALVRGKTMEYIKHLKGDSAKTNDILEGVDLSWKRVPGSGKVASLLQKAAKDFNPKEPSAIVPVLLQARQELQKLPDSYWKKVKLAELEEVVKASMGLYLEAIANDYSLTPGEPFTLNIEMVNRSGINANIRKVNYAFSEKDTILNKSLLTNQILNYNTTLRLPQSLQTSQPYWLNTKGTEGMFEVTEQELIGLSENPQKLLVKVSMDIANLPFEFSVPVVYKMIDPAVGEVYRPVSYGPPAVVNLKQNVFMFADTSGKVAQLTVRANKNNVKGSVKLGVDTKIWKVTPDSQIVELNTKGEEKTFIFMLMPLKEKGQSEFTAILNIDGHNYSQSQTVITYPHIPTQTLYPPASGKLVKLDIKKHGEKIGYIMGSGDDIPQSLEQIGYKVTLLTDEDITADKLKTFDAIVIGVRAYNTNERMKFHQPKLLEYVNNGGTVVMQYNTNQKLLTTDLGPYPFKLSRDRVTVENAEMRLLKPNHPVFNTPNKITQADFEGWVQERGLYFADEWAPEYEALLSSNDPGETPKNGGLLVAKHGKGYWVYTGYSWFRQLPAGVPGAYRLFTNIISLGKEEKKK